MAYQRDSIIAEREFDRNHKNRALLDKFLIFGMVLVMGLRFSKIIGYKFGSPPNGRYP